MIEGIAWILVVLSIMNVILATIATQAKWGKEPYDVAAVSRAWGTTILIIIVCGRVLGWW